jgi:hypothetical protein
VETLKKRGQFENVAMHEELNYKRKNVDWIYQAQDRSHWRASVNIVKGQNSFHQQMHHFY